MTCGNCDAETTRHLCQTCHNQLQQDLAETDATLQELDTTLTRQAKTSTNGAGGRTNEIPLAYHAGASDTKTNLRHTLKHWAGYTLEHLTNQHIHARPPMPATPQTLANFLLTHLDWLTDQPEAPEAHHAIRGAYAKCRRVIDTNPTMITLGACGATFSGVECVNPLRAREDAHEVTCRVCGCTWDIPDRRDAMLAEAWDVHITATEASRMFPDLTTERVSTWASRGLLTPAGERRPGHRLRARPTYVVAHVHRLTRLAATGQKLSNIDKEEGAA